MLRGVASGASTGGANNWTQTQTFTVTDASAIVISQSLTGANAQSAIDAALTWNTSGTPSALKVNVTDTASNASSLLMQLQVGGSNRLTVAKSGAISSAASIGAAAGSPVFWTSRSVMASPSDGVITISNNASNDFGRLNLGGTTASFPSLKRSTTIVQARLADDSNFAPIQGLLRTAANATTGLSAGALAATTNASIVITDAGGQAYRVPCII